MAMNATLAAMYNTHGAGDAASEEQTKIAHLELFAKAAMAQGIDLSELDESTRNELFTEFTTKLAAEDSDADDEGGDSDAESDDDSEETEETEETEKTEDEKKEAAARAEHAAMNEWQEKNAQADFLGRRMAHSFWDEYQEISKSASAGQAVDKAIGAAKNFGKSLSGSSARAAGKKLDTLKGQASSAKSMGLGSAKAAREKKIGETARTLADETSKTRKARMLAGGAAAGAAGAGAAVAASRKKEASAFDQQAAEQGLKIASAAGWDSDECIDRLNSVLTLGPAETEKVAFAGGNYEDAVSIRGMELLEQAGYPVDWTQIFGE